MNRTDIERMLRNTLMQTADIPPDNVDTGSELFKLRAENARLKRVIREWERDMDGTVKQLDECRTAIRHLEEGNEWLQNVIKQMEVPEELK